ncbi:MAG TPA: TolC family protein, partial [Terriglobales bacterium]
FAFLISTLSVAQTPAPAQAPTAPQTAPPLTLTLQDALARARNNAPQFLSTLTDAAVAREDRVQTRAALLPTVTYNNEFLYTQGNGTPSGRFIANNAVHEYVSQGNVHQAISVAQFADYNRTGAAAELARARAEVARRGLVVTVVQDFYGLAAAQRKYSTSQSALQEASRFFDISQKLEQGGEVAHADVIKAQIQLNDRQRDLRESVLAMDRARLDLAVLLFPDFNLNFTVVDDFRLEQPLPTSEEVEAAAKQNNPELAVAIAAVRQAQSELTVARAGYLPSLTFDYFYGIDATHFAVNNPDGTRNLGYAAAATLNIPVWNWGATHSKVKQGLLRARQAQVELSAAQRKLLAELKGLYSEAQTAHDELGLLRNSADLASQSLKLTTLRYQGGEATVLEVVDAQNTLTTARNAYDDGEVRYEVSLANLQTLTGKF